MAWGGLNPALTAWRYGIIARFPFRGSLSDGGVADNKHGSTSQHQRDSDASVDAYDMDVNLLGSSNPQGSIDERALIEALKKDFEADRRSHLWIHMREIANEAIRTFAEREYVGANPHDKHVHWESQQAHEDDGSPWKFTHTDALIRRMIGDEEMAFADERIKVTATTGKELFDPDKAPGTEVEAATILQLAAIWARRGAQDAAAIEARLSKLEEDIAAIKAAVIPPAE